jgi:hypothetical protein
MDSGAVREGVDAFAPPSSLMWTIRSMPISAAAVAELDHLAELPGRIHMQQREGRWDG